MAVPLVGDRFVREGAGRWRDLATGDMVAVRLHPLLGEWDHVERELLEEDSAPDEAPTLVDFGLVGRAAWFEARALTVAGGIAIPDDAIRRVTEQIALHATSWDRGVHVVRATVAPADAPVVAGAVARRLRTLGFVTLRAGIPVSEPLGRVLAHRHLTVLLCDAEDRACAAPWVRRLACTSPRLHLIADLASEPGNHRRAAARRHTRPGVGGWVVRRFGAGPRGSAKAAAGSGASGKSAVELEALVHQIKGCVRRGDLARADALLAETSALGALTGRAPPARWHAAGAEVRFWQGRFDEAAALCRAAAPDAPGPTLDADVLRALVGWSVGRRSAVAASADALHSRSGCDPGAAAWARSIAALAASLAGNGSEVRRTLEDRLAGPSLPSCWFTRVVAAEALLAVGESAAALRWLGEASPVRAPLLHQWAGDWLRERAGGAQRKGLSAYINCAGAQGVRRWGSRTMHLLHAVPVLLQLVHDAEDDVAALTASCSWLRRHGRVHAVAFLSNEGRTVAGDGWPATPADPAALADLIGAMTPRVVHVADGVLAAAPVRSAGAVIGLVVIRGPAETATTWTQAAATLAAIGAPAVRARLDALAAARDSQSATAEILGRSPAIGALRDSVARAAASPFPVLVEGESGTGKELVARAIHRLSARRDRRFSAINCAALGDDLIEAELFGHARGAFTGAIGPRAGLFEDAHGGTLMLDEVAELSARAQAKLLRVLQEREVRRLGENAPRPVDVRLIAATNRPLGELAARRRFRDDLLFRLAVIRLRLPPLRDRIEDVPLLVQASWRELTRQAGKRAVLGPDAMAALCRHHWPGNVRELQNVVAALVVEAPARGRTGARAVEGVLAASNPRTMPRAVSLLGARVTCERQTVASALARHAGRRAAAARELGLTRQGLTKTIKRLGLDVPGDRAGVA